MPKDLMALCYRAMIVELATGDNVVELHGYVLRLLANNVPVVLCGADVEQVAVRQSVTAALDSIELKVADMALHIPSHSVTGRYKYDVLRLTVLSSAPLKMRVCTTLLCASQVVRWNALTSFFLFSCTYAKSAHP